MKLVVIAFLILTALSLTAAEKAEPIKIRASVQQVYSYQFYSGVAIPLHADPRFVLVLKIETCNPALAGFANGNAKAFAIHSPTRLFGQEPVKGQSYNFLLKHEVNDGNQKFFDLQVVQPDTK